MSEFVWDFFARLRAFFVLCCNTKLADYGARVFPELQGDYTYDAMRNNRQ